MPRVGYKSSTLAEMEGEDDSIGKACANAPVGGTRGYSTSAMVAPIHTNGNLLTFLESWSR